MLPWKIEQIFYLLKVFTELVSYLEIAFFVKKNEPWMDSIWDSFATFVWVIKGSLIIKNEKEKDKRFLYD